MEQKRCCVCKIIKKSSDFYKQRKRKDGLRVMCKSCQKNYSNTHYKEIEKSKKWREGHRYSRYVISVKNRGFIPLPHNEWDLISSQPCFYCGDENITKGLDRKDNNLGYTRENCVSCCFFCNKAKSNHSLDFFLSKIRKIYDTRLS